MSANPTFVARLRVSRFTLTIAAMCTLASGIAGARARADQIIAHYDGEETFPEQQGWERYWSDPQGVLRRTIQDGAFRLDTSGSLEIFDVYMAPFDVSQVEQGEQVRLRWRMATLQTDAGAGRSDVSVALLNEFGEYVQLYLAPAYVSENLYLLGDSSLYYPLEYGAPHDFELISDLRRYALSVNGVFAFSGALHGSALLPGPRVTFGDTLIGATSVSEWNYFEAVIVPEGKSALVTIGFLVSVLRRRIR